MPDCISYITRCYFILQTQRTVRVSSRKWSILATLHPLFPVFATRGFWYQSHQLSKVTEAYRCTALVYVHSDATEKHSGTELHGTEYDFPTHSFTKYLVRCRGFSEVYAKYMTVLKVIKCLQLTLTHSRKIIPKQQQQKPWKYKGNTKQSLVGYCSDSSKKKKSWLSFKKISSCLHWLS